MKITAKPADDFAPINVVITLESQEDVEALRTLGQYDDTVPRALLSQAINRDTVERITSFQNKLVNALLKY